VLPHALELVDEWRRERERAGRILVALDFDGTISQIVPDPATARLLPEARAALERLARRDDTVVAIVTGRALRDIKARVGIPDLYYAGNHGLEIEGPGVDVVNPEAERARPSIAACRNVLAPILAAIPGAILEDKELTLSLHHRMVDDPGAVDRLRGYVAELCAADPAVRSFEGKKIIELRPSVAWDKGSATRFLLETLERVDDVVVPAIFIGDDRTDEDAFRALRGRGAGVIVDPAPPPDTAATSYVESPTAVVALLEKLAD